MTDTLNGIEIVEAVPERRWRELLESCAGANIFHTPEMFRAFDRSRGLRPELLGAVDPSGRPLALLITVRRAVREGLLARLATVAIAPGGLLWEADATGSRALGLLLEAYRRRTRPEVLVTEVRHLASPSAAAPILQRFGFVFEEHLDFRVDLGGPLDAVWERIGHRTRKKLRRVLRDARVRVRRVADRAGVAVWYALLRQTYKRARVPLADLSLFHGVLEELVPSDMAVFHLAEVGDEPAACSLELAYRDTVYGWYGGSDRRFSRFFPNELLTWRVIEWAARSGYRWYDFGGAGRPGQPYGVRDFKAKFGGEMTAHGRHLCVHAPMRWRAACAGYRLWQRIGRGRSATAPRARVAGSVEAGPRAERET